MHCLSIERFVGVILWYASSNLSNIGIAIITEIESLSSHGNRVACTKRIKPIFGNWIRPVELLSNTSVGRNKWFQTAKYSSQWIVHLFEWFRWMVLQIWSKRVQQSKGGINESISDVSLLYCNYIDQQCQRRVRRLQFEIINSAVTSLFFLSNVYVETSIQQSNTQTSTRRKSSFMSAITEAILIRPTANKPWRQQNHSAAYGIKCSHRKRNQQTIGCTVAHGFSIE